MKRSGKGWEGEVEFPVSLGSRAGIAGSAHGRNEGVHPGRHGLDYP